mmetsp:Transcript_2983/g.8868  ORF Transcript_2983/g.8868 Transcript_2983/m.8868 type:complete len:139 (+) Transcript_2983:3400-3816(+)
MLRLPQARRRVLAGSVSCCICDGDNSFFIFSSLARSLIFSGPVSLLSGLNPRPSVLVAHFFGVALFGVSRLLFPRPSVKGVISSVALIYTACCIILPIVRTEGLRAVFFPFLATTPKPSASMRKAARSASQNLVRTRA